MSIDYQVLRLDRPSEVAHDWRYDDASIAHIWVQSPDEFTAELEDEFGVEASLVIGLNCHHSSAILVDQLALRLAREFRGAVWCDHADDEQLCNYAGAQPQNRLRSLNEVVDAWAEWARGVDEDDSSSGPSARSVALRHVANETSVAVPSLHKLLGAEINGLALRWATASELERRIAGPVEEPLTLDSKSKRPAPRGLFCEEVFGTHEPSSQEASPALGKDPEVPPSSGSRFGVIRLPIEIVHPLWLTVLRDELTDVTDCSYSTITSLFEGRSFYLPDEDRIVSEEELPISLQEPRRPAEDGRVPYSYGSEAVKSRLQKKGVPAGIMMKEVLVIPTEFRPLMNTEIRPPGHDLNDLYRRVVNRSNRFKRLKKTGAPEIMILTEVRLLQQSVVALFDNRGNGFAPQITSFEKRPLESLLEGVDVDALRELVARSRSASLNSSMPNSPDRLLEWRAFPGHQLDSLRRLEAMGFSLDYEGEFIHEADIPSR